VGQATAAQGNPHLPLGDGDGLAIIGGLDLGELDASWWTCAGLARSDSTLVALVSGASGYTVVFLEPTWMTSFGYEPRHQALLGKPSQPWVTAALAASPSTVVVGVTSPVSKTIHILERSGEAWLPAQTFEILE